MERDHGFKVLAVIALLLGVVGISVGFAAFNATLTISNTDVTVSPDNTFTTNVNYDEDLAATVTSYTGATAAEYTNTEAEYTAEGSTKKLYVNPGVVTGKNWTGIEVSAKGAFTVTLTATIKNESDYLGYLHSITSVNQITCEYDPSDENILRVCNEDTDKNSTEFQVTVSVAGESVSQNPNKGVFSKTNCTGTIAKTTGTNLVTVTISYNPTVAPTEAVTFKIPTISVLYSTAANN